MEKQNTSSVFVVDNARLLKGIVTIDDAIALQRKGERDISSIIIDDVYTSAPTTSISDLLSTAIQTRYPIALVDDDGVFRGAVSRASIMAEVNKGTDHTESPIPLQQLQEELSDREDTDQ